MVALGFRICVFTIGLVFIGGLKTERLTSKICAPSRLRVEHRDVSVDTTAARVCIDSRPRFSWDVPTVTDQRNVHQYGFRVLVSSALAGNDSNRIERSAIVWDSGIIQSNHSLLVPYEGPTLSVHGVFSWNVTVWLTWDGQDLPVPSPTSTSVLFATGFNGTISDKNALSSAWITTASDDTQLRSEFALPTDKEIAEARIYFAAPGYVHVRLNGVDIMGNDTLGPWTTWSSRMLYRYYDVTSMLQTCVTDNVRFYSPTAVVGVWMGNGQYRSKWTRAWYNKGSPPLALALEVHATFSDGSRAVLLSTNTTSMWKAHASPIVSNDVYAGETYNASAYMQGWDLPGYDTTDWGSVEALSPQDNPLSARISVHQYTPIRIVDLVTALNVSQIGPSTFLYWFPRNSAGVVQLHVPPTLGTLPAGTKLTLKHGEQLYDADGKTPCLVACFGRGKNVYYPFGGAVDTYIASGSPQGESWRPRFTYHGFQFLEVSGWPNTSIIEAPTLDTFKQVVIHSDNQRLTQASPSFSASLLTNVYDNIVHSLQSNMHSVQSDCPTRERVGWTGDAQATAETAFRTLEVGSFYTKWLQDMRDAQLESGGLSSTVPYAKHVPPVDPSWPTAFPQLVRLMYTYYGDLDVVADNFDAVRRYVDYIPTVNDCPNCKNGKNPRAPNGLPWFYMNGDWMEYRSQAEELTLSGPILASFHYILDVEIVAEMAALLNKTSIAAQYDQLATALWGKFNEVYLHNSTVSGSPHVCDRQRELKKGGRAIVLTCGRQGGIIASVWAAFGTPSGNCSTGFHCNVSCDAPTATAIVSKLCLGKAQCTLEPETQVFGDPCVGIVKALAVNVTCRGGTPAPPAPPATSWSYGAGQAVNAVPLMHPGVVPTDKFDAVGKSLMSEIATSGHLTTGFIGNKYIFPALLKLNQTDTLVTLALQTSLPSMGYQVAQGATTLWENWSGAPDESNGNAAPSHDHHFLGGFGQFYWESVLGLQQGFRTGFEHMLIFPALTADPRLTWARGKVLTPRGAVEISWRRHISGPLELNVSVPPNSHATVVLPGTMAGTNARQWAVWESGRPLCFSQNPRDTRPDAGWSPETASHTHRLRCRAGALASPSHNIRVPPPQLARVDVGSGTFAFTVTP
eukprot:m.701245 g.701245  ORF g.701245 m.701245 type:complete len:1133 (+) comp22912_c0_seq3:114-3512(+)